MVAALGGCLIGEDAEGSASQETAGSGIAAQFIGTGSLGPAKFEIRWGHFKAKQHGPLVLTMQEIVFQPGGHTGWHTHGGTALATIVEGTLTLFQGSSPCFGTPFPAGTAFVDPGGGNVHIARNLGNTTALVRVQYINEFGTAIRIDAPAPRGAEQCGG